LIGVTSTIALNENARTRNSYTLRMKYAEAIAMAGGNAVILPAASAENAGETLARLDGLILSGGSDIPHEVLHVPPHASCHYMPIERWRSDVLWLTTAQKMHMPVLGVCLGMQEMNVAAGGSLIQDIPTERPGALPHARPDEMCQHEVKLTEGSKVAGLARSPIVAITSAHHQGIDKVAEAYRVVATSSDGIIEAIESPSDDFLVGVQWHPERCLDQPNWLLEGFVRICGRAACGYNAAREDDAFQRCPLSQVLNKVLEKDAPDKGQ
jgi:putative glutamine amidotransferase